MLEPGVKVEAAQVQMTFNPAEFNPEHVRHIVQSPQFDTIYKYVVSGFDRRKLTADSPFVVQYGKAKPMAVNMYSGLWTLIVCVVTLVGVSLVTKPKPDAELRDLVMGLTVLPDQGPCPWYKHPYLWATIVAVVLVAINIIFW